MIVLDTNVVSELVQRNPEPAVIRWLRNQPLSEIYLSAPTQAEILYGLASMPEGRRRDDLTRQLRDLLERTFLDRTLPFDGVAAHEFALIATRRKRQGRPIQILDAQIAAIALSRGAAVATRNVKDFEDCGVTIINPWTA